MVSTCLQHFTAVPGCTWFIIKMAIVRGNKRILLFCLHEKKAASKFWVFLHTIILKKRSALTGEKNKTKQKRTMFPMMQKEVHMPKFGYFWEHSKLVKTCSQAVFMYAPSITTTTTSTIVKIIINSYCTRLRKILWLICQWRADLICLS